VGQAPPAFAEVRRAHIGSRKHAPARVIAQRGKGSDHFPASTFSSSDGCDVFQEDEAGSKDASDSDDLGE